jgi:hypothetical protein
MPMPMRQRISSKIPTFAKHLIKGIFLKNGNSDGNSDGNSEVANTKMKYKPPT